MRGSRRCGAVVSVLAALVGLLIAWAPAAAAAPVVSSFTPTSGGVGTAVTITGSGFTSVTAVKFNGTTATYTVKSATSISTSVPHGATSGPISVTASGGTGTSSTSFTVTSGEQVSPSIGPPTSNVTVYGSGFAAHEAVDVYAGTADVALAVSDANGNVSVATQVPASAQPGSFWFTLVGRRTGTATQAAFTVRTSLPQSLGNAAHTSWNRFENTITPANAGSLDLAWRKSIGTVSANGDDGMPAVSGGHLYLDTFTATGSVTSELNPATGATMWSRSWSSDNAFRTPAVYRNTVVVAFYSGSVIGLNASTGATLWIHADSGDPPAGAPTVTGSGAYVVYKNGGVLALSLAAASAGSVEWNESMSADSDSTAAVSAAGGTVVTVDSDGDVYAWDATTGNNIWALGIGEDVDTTPVIAGNRIYVSGEDGDVNCLLLDGLFGFTSPQISTMQLSAPAFGNGLLYVTAPGDGTLTALSAATGKQVWQAPSTNFPGGAPFLAGGVLWVYGSGDQELAVDPSNGAVLGGVGGYDGVVVADGRIYSETYAALSAHAPPSATSGQARPRIAQLYPDRSLVAHR